MKTFLLPDLGEGLHEARLCEWLAAPGAVVAEGEALVTVETAKAVVEIPAPCPLTLTGQRVKPGDSVHVGAPLFDYQEGTDTATPAPIPMDKGSVVGELGEAPANAEQRRFIPGRRHFTSEQQAEAAQRCQPGTRTVLRIRQPCPPPLSGMRLHMHRHMTQAHREVVQVTVFEECLLAKRPRPLLPLVIVALGRACQAVPQANAWLQGETLTPQTRMQLGIAMDTEAGLVVPVLREADSLSLSEITEHLETLKQRARAGQLRPEDSRGATISLSSYGGTGGWLATPLVMPPQVAILGVGRLRKHLYLSRKGKPRTAWALPLSLSFDHRALTGGEAIRFLQAFSHELTTLTPKTKDRR